VNKLIPAQQVTWMELFYDVVIAASMLLIYGSLAKHLSWPEFFWLSTIALVVFASWLSTTLIYNQLPADTTWRRLFIIVQMITIVYAVAAMENSDRVDGDVGIIALGIAMLILAAMWEAGYRSSKDTLQPYRRQAAAFAIGAAFLLSAVFLPDSLNAEVFIIGALIGFVPMFVSFVPRLYSASSMNMHHLVERLGGLVLIMLGETFLEMSVLFTKGGNPRIFGVLLVLVLLTIVWWQYFTYVASRPVTPSVRGLEFFLLGHALLVLGLGSAALALTEVALALEEALTLPVIAGILGGSLALVYAGLTIIVANSTGPRSQLIILTLTTTSFGSVGFLFWATWELDEQTLSLLMIAIALGALLLTAGTSRTARSAARSQSHHAPSK
jgi:low temperature requirement protein LtrA